MSAWDLRLGRWQDALADVGQVDAIITDPPYSARTHGGHNSGIENAHGMKNPSGSPKGRASLDYAYWTQADVDAFVDSWAPRCRGWFVALTDHALFSAWEAAYERSGLTAFAPVVAWIPGMSIRLSGDGPSSWAIYAAVARPKALSRWGTLPGGYSGQPSRTEGGYVVAGAKPLWLMRALVRDYTKPGDLVCDPCAGGATTLLAAVTEGCRALGSEMDPVTYAKARKRLEQGYTPCLDFGVASP